VLARAGRLEEAIDMDQVDMRVESLEGMSRLGVAVGAGGPEDDDAGDVHERSSLII
jgi:hypothetical protein